MYIWILFLINILNFSTSNLYTTQATRIALDTIQYVHLPATDVYFSLALIPGGEYILEDQENKSVHLDGFWIGTQEVRHDEYILFQDEEKDTPAAAYNAQQLSVDAIARPTPPYEDFSKGMGTTGGFPAVSMTQQAALKYCHWLYWKTGLFFRLPTEAEWTIACRLGRSEETFEETTWYRDNSEDKFQKTAQKHADALGIYDMTGNIAEWTLDEYHDDYASRIDTMGNNPWVQPKRRHSRTVKGGSYRSAKEQCSCQYRMKSSPRWQRRDPQIPKSKWWNTDSPFVGFRVVMPVKQPSPNEVSEFFNKAIVY